MPEILFDIQSNISIDVCLDVLAQNLIDTCRHHHNQLIMNDNNSEEENKNSLSMCRNSRIPGNHHRLLIHPKHIYEKLITRPTRQRQIEKIE